MVKNSATSHTFANGVSVQFAVLVPSSMPHPVELLDQQYQRAPALIAASVPIHSPRFTSAHSREKAGIEYLDCIHWQPARVLVLEDGSQKLYCPDCRRSGTLAIRPLGILDMPGDAKRDAQNRH